jgi:hypothetical protein
MYEYATFTPFGSIYSIKHNHETAVHRFGLCV